MTEPRTRDLEGLRKKFRNFDEVEIYEEAQKATRKSETQNFVVLFGPHHAKIAVDLGPDDFEDLFALQDPDCPVRWINFWNTQQKHAIDIIGDNYGFTRRLRASIIDWDKYRKENRDADARKTKLKDRLRLAKDRGITHDVEETDLEKGLGEEPAEPPHIVPESELAATPAGQNFRVLQNSLNYTTTDYGTDCK